MNEFQKGQIVFAGSSTGVILDIFENGSGKKVYQIYFVKNAMRLQPAEVQIEENLIGLKPATRQELEADVKFYKATVDKRLTEIREAIDNAVHAMTSNIA